MLSTGYWRRGLSVLAPAAFLLAAVAVAPQSATAQGDAQAPERAQTPQPQGESQAPQRETQPPQAGGQAESQSGDALRVIVFAGGFNLPIWAAQEQGYFEDEGVKVELTPTPGSAFQLQNLIEGNFDIAMTAADNVVAYQEGQGEAELKAEPNLAIVMGTDNGFLSLVTAPEVKTFDDVKGKLLAVDALTTGYAFVLLEMLDRNGITQEDVKIERFGGVLKRWEALQKGEHQGTMLITPFDLLAEDAGFNVLARATDELGAYQGLTVAVQRDWAEKNRDRLVGYLAGYLRGLEWLYDPANREAGIALLRKNIPQMSEDVAARAFDVLVNKETGFFPTGELDTEGLQTVLELRSKWGQEGTDLQDPQKYVDLSYYEEALKEVDQQ